jgi:hypothetical protein
MTDTKPSDTPRTDALVNDKPNDWGVTYAASIIELARELERELTRIHEAEMPEPENGFYTVTGVWWTTSMGEDKKHFVRKDDYDALKAYAQRKDAEMWDMAMQANITDEERLDAERERDALRKVAGAAEILQSGYPHGNFVELRQALAEIVAP